MNIFIQNIDKLKFSWHPCYYAKEKKYIVGPTSSPTNYLRFPLVLPHALVFYIDFVEENNILFNRILENLDNLEDNISVDLQVKNRTNNTYHFLRKNEKEIIEEDPATKIFLETGIKLDLPKKINLTLDQIISMKRSSTKGKEDGEFSDEAFSEWSRINVCCHFGTKFYQFFHSEHDVLFPLTPEYYKKHFHICERDNRFH